MSEKLALELVIMPDPRLKRRCTEVSVFDEDLARKAEALAALCRQHDGLGLGANQGGLTERFFVCLFGGVTRVCVNPQVLITSGVQANAREACLSDPYGRYVVRRPVGITMGYVDVKGVWHVAQATNLEARCWQHEIDHLDGVNIRDRGRRVK